MRADNLIIVALGLAAAAFAVVVIVRWGRLPVRATPSVAPSASSPTVSALSDAAWSLASLLSAAIVAGVLIAGLLARAIMRVAGGISPEEVQGRITDADEVIGEITAGGTLGVMVFVGLLGALVALGLYFVARPWLPATARGAGAIVGLVVMGLVGPGDPLDPDNVDFALLSYDALTVVLIMAGSVLFGMAFVSLAARFDQAARSGSRARWLLVLGAVFCLLVPIAFAALVYLAGRTLLPGKLRAILERRPVQVVGRAIIVIAVFVSIGRLASVAVDIVRA